MAQQATAPHVDAFSASSGIPCGLASWLLGEKLVQHSLDGTEATDRDVSPCDGDKHRNYKYLGCQDPAKGSYPAICLRRGKQNEITYDRPERGRHEAKKKAHGTVFNSSNRIRISHFCRRLSKRLMSALGQKRTSANPKSMSAVPPEADMDQNGRSGPLLARRGIIKPTRRAP